ncbi:HNH endonuclease [Oerskovia jenensis]|uniref:HNH endonuclease n=1 Tax=Oerskovia jenensis TaxID=162169 RepID=UPI0036DB39CB
MLRRDRFRCQIRGPRCLAVATEADHVVPDAEGGAPFALENGQAVCAECHADKTKLEAARGREKFSRYRRPRAHPAGPVSDVRSRGR